MKAILLIFSFLSAVSVTSFYSFDVVDVDGGLVNVPALAGKKVLLVNVASQSKYKSQFASLKALQQQYGDSVTVLAFPSNSFGNEPLANNRIRHYYDSAFQVNFPVAYLAPVTGNNPQDLYKWITDSLLNGRSNSRIEDDFQKYLVSSRGELMAIFSSTVDPMDSQITQTIKP